MPAVSKPQVPNSGLAAAPAGWPAAGAAGGGGGGRDGRSGGGGDGQAGHAAKHYLLDHVDKSPPVKGIARLSAAVLLGKGDSTNRQTAAMPQARFQAIE